MKRLFSILLISLFLVSCVSQEQKPSNTKPSSVQTIELAENAQTVYWLCKANPDGFIKDVNSWRTKYGSEAVDKGLQLWNAEETKLLEDAYHREQEEANIKLKQEQGIN